MAAQVHDRSLDERIEFSQSYFWNDMVVLVRNGDGATVLEHFADRQIGVVLGTRAHQAAERWLARLPDVCQGADLAALRAAFLEVG